MYRYFKLSALLLITMLLAACSTPASSNDEPDPNNGSSGGSATGEMVSTIEQLDEDSYRYSLKNQTEETVTFDFTSGQRYDFALFNDKDEQVFLFSSVSSYIQALGEETISPTEELSYEFDIPPLELEAGTYKLEAWLTPKQGPAYPANSNYKVE